MQNTVTLYHISPNDRRESILKNGIEPRGYNGKVIKYEPRIFVSNSKKNLPFDYIGYENVDVWEIITEQALFADPFSSYKGHFYLKEHISVKNLRLIKCY